MTEPNYLINVVWNWIKAHWLVSLIAALILALVLLWLAGALGGQVERFKQWRFDKSVAAKQAEIDTLSSENKRLTEEMKRAFAFGEAKELERDAAYAELERYGAAARAAVEAQKEAAKQYEDEKAAIDVDVSLHQRCLDLCAERAGVGYPCRPSTDVYCSRYTGR